MNFMDLSKNYLERALVRLELLTILKEKKAYADVVREAQEIVELATKGMLRSVGIDPPKVHDVSDLLVEYKERLPEAVKKEVDKIRVISKKLRGERELSFYGEVDFIPSEEYALEDAEDAIAGALYVVKMAEKVIK